MNVEEKNSYPYPKGNILSRLFYWSAIPLFRKGMKGNLMLNDVYDCPPDDTSENIGDAMQIEWEKERERSKCGKEASLMQAVIRVFGLKYCLIGSCIGINFCVCIVGRALLFRNLIRKFTEMSSSTWDLYLDGIGLLLLNILSTFLYQKYLFESMRSAMQLKTACCLLIYKKALKLSQSALSSTSVGQMVNLLSNDVSKFNEASIYLPFIVVGPLQFLIVACVVWMLIGYTGLAGMALLFMYLPFQIIMGKISASLRLKTASLSDERINLMNDIVDQVRGIKMYGWEIPFAKLVEDARRNEMKKIFQMHLIRGMIGILHSLSYRVMLLISIAIFVLIVGGDLTPYVVFTCILLFYALRIPMITGFMQSITFGAEAIMAFKRIQKFLLLEEHSNESNLDVSDKRPNPDKCEILLDGVEASWNKETETTLRDMSLNAKSGDLLAVVGPVGCGKTSLLMTILGELPIIAGQIKIEGRIAFASQEPWIFDGTVRQNVTFGNVFDDSRYNAVLSACALYQDIDSFPNGDMTIVGEKGVRLSGGQKARLNLARAIYLDADIFLLDDPLSAVDSSVSKHLFDKCINEFLKGKIRILVTHHLQYLKKASKILVMEKGMCSAVGTYQQLIDAGIDLSSYIVNHNQQNMGCFLPEPTGNGISTDEEILNHDNDESYSDSNYPTNISIYDNSKKDMKFYQPEDISKYIKESKSSASENRNVYKEYLKSSAGALFWILFLLSQVIAQVIMIGSEFWVTNWSAMEQLKHNTRDCWGNLSVVFLNKTGYYDGNISQYIINELLPDPNDVCYKVTKNYTMDVDGVIEKINEEYQISVYGGLLLILIVVFITKACSFFKMCMSSSCTLHDKLFRSILRSPILFFDKIPVGNILNRVSQDMGVIDAALPYSCILTFEVFCDVLGVIMVIIIVEPYMIIPTVVFAVISSYLFRINLPTIKSLKRHEGITRSPTFSLLSSSLNGLSTIRNMKMQISLTKLFQQHQDKNTSTFIAFILCTHCFNTFIEMLCSLYSVCVIVFMILLSGDPSFAARAGLAVSMSLQLCLRFQFLMKIMAEAENQMTSVERVLDYTDLKSEGELESKTEKRLPKNWPSKGHILYKNIYLRYSPNQAPVLKDLSFEVYPGEKIGIVGRTGAGKSSLISSLFRLTEPEGLIQIDDVCTTDIGLHDLRKRITIIPQDPILFTGTIRKNLDLFGENTDDDLLQALEEAFLKEHVQLLSGGLDAKVSEKGSNFSVGQRQLICLARAILRKNRVLVLDEATANVDLNTDRLIQLVIRRRFADCTILIIAHRLHTIMDADRVLVMESGEIKEFDTPYNLLQNPDGIFSYMLRMTGPVMSMQLKDTAVVTYMQRLAENRMVTDLNKEGQTMDDADATSTQIMNSSLTGCVNKAYDIEITHL